MEVPSQVRAPNETYLHMTLWDFETFVNPWLWMLKVKPNKAPDCRALQVFRVQRLFGLSAGPKALRGFGSIEDLSDKLPAVGQFEVATINHYESEHPNGTRIVPRHQHLSSLGCIARERSWKNHRLQRLQTLGLVRCANTQTRGVSMVGTSASGYSRNTIRLNPARLSIGSRSDGQ